MKILRFPRARAARGIFDVWESGLTWRGLPRRLYGGQRKCGDVRASGSSAAVNLRPWWLVSDLVIRVLHSFFCRRAGNEEGGRGKIGAYSSSMYVLGLECS